MMKHLFCNHGSVITIDNYFQVTRCALNLLRLTKMSSFINDGKMKPHLNKCAVHSTRSMKLLQINALVRHIGQVLIVGGGPPSNC